MCTHKYTIFIVKKKITPDYSNSAAMGFFPVGPDKAHCLLFPSHEILVVPKK